MDHDVVTQGSAPRRFRRGAFAALAVLGTSLILVFLAGSFSFSSRREIDIAVTERSYGNRNAGLVRRQ
ncbi:hypothetical protein HDU93_008227, partial [Gonapodya sp. JEL0774]